MIAEAARLMPNRVIGIIGVDTLENIEYAMTREELDRMIGPLKKNFKAGSREFVREMISSDTNPLTREWILSDMSTVRVLPLRTACLHQASRDTRCPGRPG